MNLHFYLALVLSFLAIPVSSYSNDSTPDILLSTFKNTNNDSVRVYALREIVNFWKARDCDSSIYYSKRLIPEAKKVKNHKFVYKGYYWIVNCYGAAGLQDSALHYAFEGIKYFQNDSNYFPRTVLYALTGEQYRAMAMFENALVYLNKSWKEANNAGNLGLQSSANA